jgi:phenylacetic acid degradation operon negative regulatory protein
MKHRKLGEWISARLKKEPPRAKSLLVTIWGDSIVPHGGESALSSIITLAKAFNVSDRLVRTSVFRLTRDGWLAGVRSGRRSYYRLTADGRRRVEHAYRRIYAHPVGAWDSNWLIAVVPPNSMMEKARDNLRRELGWEGFGILGPGIYARPGGDLDSVKDILKSFRATDKVVVFNSREIAGADAHAAKELVRNCWNLDGLASSYRAFERQFAPALKLLREISDLDPEQAFAVRTLVVHSFRRVLLKDPQLPHALLPADWPGLAAYELTRDIYTLTRSASQKHLEQSVELERGSLPAEDKAFQKRFSK